jgi:small subunit ribosomal protein S17
MADDETTPEETPETPAADETSAIEETPVAETAVDEPTAAADRGDEAAVEQTGDDAEPAEAAPTLSRKEQRAQTRHEAASKRAPRSAEERQGERLEERKRKAAQRTRRRQKAKAARPAERGPQKTVSPVEHGPGRPKVRQGLVVSDKADKTITVRIESARRHRRYEKIVRSSSTLHAHDEANDAHTGDLVRIIESRPLSRLKRWRLVEVLERAK